MSEGLWYDRESRRLERVVEVLPFSSDRHHRICRRVGQEILQPRGDLLADGALVVIPQGPENRDSHLRHLERVIRAGGENLYVLLAGQDFGRGVAGEEGFQ